VAEASERRTAALSLALAPARREGRTRLPGLLLYAAADAVAEVRQSAAPATLGSSTLSGVEDHATFAPLALRLLQRSLARTTEVMAVEALHAADLLAVLDVRPTGAGTGRLAAALAETFDDPVDGRSAAALVRETARLLTA
jgi:histidine ammonia-lyase